MSRPNQRARERSPWAWSLRVCPVLELLEDREPPSSFPIDRLLALPVDEPVVASQEATRNVESKPVLIAAEAAPAEAPSAAALGVLGAPVAAVALVAERADTGLADRVSFTAPVDALSGRTASLALLPGRIDLSAGADLGGRGSPQRGENDSHQANSFTNTPPDITDFHAVENDDGTWTFEGHVDSAYVGGLTIDFGSAPAGSMPSLDGQTAEVQTDGSFQMTVKLQNCEQGIVTAQTSDPQGHGSNVAEDYVQQSGCGSHPGR